MTAFRARVQKRLLVVDEAADIPEGTLPGLFVDDEGDNLTDEERAEPHAAIEGSVDDAKAGPPRQAAPWRRPLKEIPRGMA